MFKTLSLCVLGFAAVKAAEDGMDWKEWEWETSFFGLMEQQPFVPEWEYSLKGNFANNDSAEWFNGMYLLNGQFVWSTDYSANQAGGQHWEHYQFNPVDVGGSAYVTMEFAKWYYHTAELVFKAAEVNAMKFSVAWPIDWRNFWDEDHEAGTNDDFSFKMTTSFKYNQATFTQH